LIQGLVQVVPPRIIFLDQLDFPGAPPLFDLAFATKRSVARVMWFVPDKDVDAVLGREALECLLFVLPDPFGDIVGVAAVERSIALTGQQVGVEYRLPLLRTFQEHIIPLIPAKAGTHCAGVSKLSASSATLAQWIPAFAHRR